MHIKHSEHFTEFNYYYICFILLLLLLFYIQIFSYFRCKYVIKRSVQFSSVQFNSKVFLYYRTTVMVNKDEYNSGCVRA